MVRENIQGHDPSTFELHRRLPNLSRAHGNRQERGPFYPPTSSLNAAATRISAPAYKTSLANENWSIEREVRVGGPETGLHHESMTAISRGETASGLLARNNTIQTQPSARGTKRAAEMDIEDGPRKHGKRLTTKEEVSLFEMCNRHAGTFGKRSDICNWWKTIAAEFTFAHGRPYSWHSVRRKVEIVTKQRIKFLDEQQQRQRDFSGPNVVEDLMNPQWCAVLDIWIPNWQRWEEAEARRIAKRDEMIMRRRSSKSGDVQWRSPDEQAGRVGVPSPASPDGMVVGTGHSFHDESTHAPSDALQISDSTPTLAPAPAPAPVVPIHSFEHPPAPASNAVRLPPGFENMFSNPIPIGQPTPPVPVTPSTTPADPSPNNRMFGAVLETLGKLNKHLDAASGNGGADVRASPVISALVQAASDSNSQAASIPSSEREIHQYPGSYDINRMKDELRQELRAELRHEMKRDRAALEEKLDSVQRTQEMILEMLRQEPA